MKEIKFKNIGTKIGICFGAVLIACIIFWVGIWAGQKQANDRFTLNNAAVLSGDSKNEGNQKIFSCVLPEEFENGQSVLFKSSHAVVEVMLDGNIVYTFGTEKPAVGKSPGTCWHIVDLPEDSAGLELVIYRTSVYSSYRGSDANFYFGSRGDCILRLVDNYLYVLIMNSVSIVLGLICLLMYARTLKRKEIRAGNGFLWIGLFALMIAVWSLRQSGFLRFLIPYSQILYFIDIHLLFLAAIPLDMFVYSISKTKWGKSCLWFIPVYLIGAVFGTLMQVVGAFDIVEMLTALHVLIGINVAYMFWAVHREAWKNKGSAASRFCIPLYTMMAFGIMEMVHYYMPSRTTSIFLPTGVMVFILMLVWQQVSAYFHTLEKQKLTYYEKFANTDMLTGAFNRNAYETKLKQLAADQAQLNGCGAALFDVNGLKYINDNHGHEKGDEAIKRCYNLITTAFGGEGSCYRIGGDEFVVLTSGETDIAQKVADFEHLVAHDRERLDFPFTVAFGYALFDAERDKGLQDTIKRSDAMMYLNKNTQKQAGHENNGEQD